VIYWKKRQKKINKNYEDIEANRKKTKKNEKLKKKEVELKKKVNLLIENKLNVLKSDYIKLIVKNEEKSKTEINILGHYPDPKKIFQQIFNEEFWRVITEKLNYYWSKKTSKTFKSEYKSYISKKVLLFLI